MSITEILAGKNLLTPAQLGEVAALAQAQAVRLDQAILQLGYLNERQVLEVMGECLNIPLADMDAVVLSQVHLPQAPGAHRPRERHPPRRHQRRL
jgi:hypothetical protein